MTQTPIGTRSGEFRRVHGSSLTSVDTGSPTTSFVSSDPEAQRRSELALFLKTKRAALSAVAQFRAETARHAGAPELLALTRTLAQDSAEFASLWQARQLDVLQLKAKRLRHSELGIVDLSYAPLRPRGVANDLSVVVYSMQQ